MGAFQTSGNLVTGTIDAVALDHDGNVNTVLWTDRKFTVMVKWHLDTGLSLIVPPAIWNVRAFLESLGSGAEEVIGLPQDVPMQWMQADYSATIEVTPPFTEVAPAPSMLYRIVVVLTTYVTDAAGTRIPLAIDGYGEGPIIQFVGGEYDRELPQATIRPLPLSQSRVLNASFAVVSGKSLSPDETLTAGEFYDLLVDVGPRRNESIVTDTRKVIPPIQALPLDRVGYIVEVIFLSDQFLPSFVTTQIWVPRQGGSSSPLVDGQPQRQGPVAMRVRAPTLASRDTSTPSRAFGRLNLYFENNLLQSALVDVPISSGPHKRLEIGERQRIDVDYALTATYAELQALKTRQVQFVAKGDPGEHPIRVNLMMNSNGNGGHRIVVKGTTTSPNPCKLAGYIPYNPVGSGKVLDVARNTLFDCYFARDAAGQVTEEQRRQKPVFDNRNGKSRALFKRDLEILAIQGSKLLTLAFADVKVEEGECTQAQWKRNLLDTLKDSSIIQVTRLSSASYVFPWALVYEHPLPDRDELRMCPIVDEEWGKNGTRRQRADKVRTRCKYHDEEWHKKNIFCPYGFWGLKHIIEEPQSINHSPTVSEVGRCVFYSDKIDLAVSITQDARMVDIITAHLKKIGKIRDIRFVSPRPATGWRALRPNLKAPEIVYFLCHGECDSSDALNTAYLSIGLRDNDPDHRVYAVGTIGSWIVDMVDGPDTNAWAQRRPLVFINGCHTNGLHPGHIVSFASMFAGLGACGTLGTEVRVPISVATEVAESFFAKIAPSQRMTVGEALRQIRWELVNKGNLLGLAYSLYGLADVRIETTD